MRTENPTIEWITKANKEYLKFIFHDMLTEDNAMIAISKWKEAFLSRPKKMITLIWDCRSMTGYDTESRVAWQNTLKELKPQIDDIWLITTSKMIQVGAQIMTVFTSLNINVVSSEDQIKW